MGSAKGFDLWEYEMSRIKSTEDNVNKFNKVSKECQSSLDEILRMRTSLKDDTVAAPKKLDDTQETSFLTSGMARVTTLKKYNRMEKMLLKQSRDKVSEARQRVDKQHLQFRNLMYELHHLRTEIAKCLDHKSADDDIELVTKEQFFASAPASISRPEITESDPHELRKARLDWELEQRKTLKDEHSTLAREKKMVLARIKHKKAALDSLLPKLKEVIEVTKPLQEPLGIPKEKTLRHGDFLRIFPMPMYILYCRIKAYKDALEPSLQLDIFGDIDELTKQMSEVTTPLPPRAEIEDLDTESQEVSENRGERERERRVSTSSSKPLEEISVTTKLKATIHVTAECKKGDQTGHIKLIFSYYPKLNIVSVGSSVVTASEGPSISSGGDLIRPSTLLTWLFPGDTGDKMPTLASELMVTGKEIEFTDVFFEDKPYVWAQILAGIDVTAESSQPPSTVNMKKDLVSTDFEKILSEIRSRLRSRVALQQVLAEIDAGHFALPKKYFEKLPFRTVANVSRLTSVDWSEAAVHLSSRNIFQYMEAQKGFVYQTEVKSGEVGVIAYFVVPFNFPSDRIVFFLCWSPASSYGDSEQLLEIEREVNYNLLSDMNPNPDESLLVQFQALRQSVDIVAAFYASEIGATVEASGTKLFHTDVRSNTKKKEVNTYLQLKNNRPTVTDIPNIILLRKTETVIISTS